MKTWQKITFVVVLVVFVSASVTISLISISRPPYKYEEISVGDGDPVDGWEFYAFNGNNATSTLHVDYVRDKNGNDPDESKPVAAIRKYAVNADEYVKEITIGAHVQYIDETAFFNVKKLQRITVDPANEWFKDVDGVLYSKDGKRLLLYPICYGEQPTDAEDEFTYPEAYTVPDGVERIGTFAFLKNGHLRDLTLPDSLKEIGDMAFFDCGRLGAYDYDAQRDTLLGTGFALPDSVETIGSDAFSKCSNIAPVLYIPSSVREIGHHAFFSCMGMANIYLGAADDSGMVCGDAWLPKNIKTGAVKKAPDPAYGKTRAESEKLIEEYRTTRLDELREEAKENG